MDTSHETTSPSPRHPHLPLAINGDGPMANKMMMARQIRTVVSGSRAVAIRTQRCSPPTVSVASVLRAHRYAPNISVSRS